MHKKGIAILGSTGSIGTQALEVIEANPELFDLQVLTANSNADLLITQAIKYKPYCVVIVDESKYDYVQQALSKEDVFVFGGADSLCQVVESSNVQLVLTAMVGFSGLKPTIAAINAGKNIALANKETLVVAGELVTKLAQEKGVNIYPVDSEHSAIFQCLAGEFHNPIEKIILTASGGPFRGFSKEQLEHVTLEQALNHPNWVMGSKITIDSASMMNKGLEVIEAKWLFDLRLDQIEVIVHPQSIIHSIVQFEDGSMKAQMGLPDMRLPIQYAFSYPNRLTNNFERFNFLKYPQFTFETVDTNVFKNLDLAFQALQQGGTAPCVLNAANEITVSRFLDQSIRFVDIARINEIVLSKMECIQNPSLSDLMEIDAQARILAKSIN